MADPDPHPVSTAELAPLAGAIELLNEHAEVNHRYRKLIDQSRHDLAQDRIRSTQARGIAKKLIVLVRAAGPQLREDLTSTERDTLDAALAQAHELVSVSPN